MAVTALKKEAEFRQYCDSVYRELSEIKRKIFNIVCGVETTTPEEEARKAEYFDLIDLVDEIEKKLASLSKRRSREWRRVRNEIESGKKKLEDAVDWWFG